MAKVIEKILKKLTPERVKREVEKVYKTKLPPELQKWVEEYEKVGQRDDFIWKWTYLNMIALTLPSVSKQYRKSIIVTKCISIILNVLLDDLADNRKDEEMMEAAINICDYPEKTFRNLILAKFNKTDQEYLNLVKKAWDVLNRDIKKYPRYNEFKTIFLYDYHQFFSAIRYGYLINKNLNLINLGEYKMYFSHNMQGMISVTIDLMASPKFNTKELGTLREIAWRAQRMGRIGNSITTWERELHENDFSSEVFAYALENKIINEKDLIEKNQEKIAQNIKKAKVEKYFLRQREKYFNEIKELSKRIHSVNIKKLLKGLNQLIVMHLISVGLK